MRHPRPCRCSSLVLPLLALAACGDDSPSMTRRPRCRPSSHGADRAAHRAGHRRRRRTSYDVATGADDVVVSVANEGGFVPPGLRSSTRRPRW